MRKLVRDRIPELSGKPAEKAGDLIQMYLRRKVAEEVLKLSRASQYETLAPLLDNYHSVKEEAADVITAVLALCNTHGLCWEEIEEEIKRKGKEKGGFGAGFVMEVEG